ncbi:MAG: hypothetical protein Q9182_000302 [Xanthomendoza sp. 2 TL-2023]
MSNKISSDFRNYVDHLSKQDYPDSDPTDSRGLIESITQYLDGRITTQEAAIAYARPFTFDGPRLENEGSRLVYMTAESVPGAQKHLLDLLVAIDELPKVKRGDNVEHYHLRPFFHAMQTHWESQIISLKDHNDEPLRYQRCINLTAFIARFGAHEEEELFPTVVIKLWELLESNHNIQTQRSVTLLRAALEYVEHAGSLLYAIYSQQNYSNKAALNTGFGGPAENLWACWKRRFEELSGKKDLEQGTREVVKRGAEIMAQVEKESLSWNQVAGT